MHSPEWYEKRDICQYLDEIGAWYFKPSMNGYGGSGVSDIIGCYRGHFFSIEVKRPGRKPSKLQAKRIEEVQNANGEAFWGTAAKVCSEMRRFVCAVAMDNP